MTFSSSRESRFSPTFIVPVSRSKKDLFPFAIVYVKASNEFFEKMLCCKFMCHYTIDALLASNYFLDAIGTGLPLTGWTFFTFSKRRRMQIMAIHTTEDASKLW